MIQTVTPCYLNEKLLINEMSKLVTTRRPVKKSIPVHWGTFQLSYEPNLETAALLAGALKIMN